MSELVTYRLADGIAVVTMDDGKANLMRRPMLAALAAAFDRAEADEAVVVLTGRAKVFSAGYDTAVFSEPIEEIAATLQAGGGLVEKMLAHPFPIIGAANGHAIAQGAFTLLACDVRIGVTGEAKTGLNEVAIGLTIPHYGIEVARHQLAPMWFDHATLTGTPYDPETACRAGFFHELVEAGDLVAAAADRAAALVALDMAAHSGTKQRVRRRVLDVISESLTHEFVTSPSTA